MSKTSFSGPLYVGGVPFMGAQGIFTQGQSWFVKPNTGSDGNSGKTADQALKTLDKAHTLATADQNDTVYLFGQSNTAANTTDYQSATLTWSKDLVHLVGICAPSAVSQRARIAQLSTATGVSPLINITADGCIFKNFSVFHGVNDATSLIAVTVTGTRNYFENVHFAGVGHATMSAAGSSSLKIDGGDENVFESCVIGLDTITRDADVAEIWLDSDASRNIFRNCLIQGYISAAGYVHVKIQDSTGIDRWLKFDNCTFLSESVNDTVTQTSVFSIPAMSQGYILLKDCLHVTPGASGSGDWDSNNRGRLYNNSVASAAAAVGGISTKQ